MAKRPYTSVRLIVCLGLFAYTPLFMTLGWLLFGSVAAGEVSDGYIRIALFAIYFLSLVEVTRKSADHIDDMERARKDADMDKEDA